LMVAWCGVFLIRKLQTRMCPAQRNSVSARDDKSKGGDSRKGLSMEER
jgi:hypothetical protein